jgi:hypothetical protein
VRGCGERARPSPGPSPGRLPPTRLSPQAGRGRPGGRGSCERRGRHRPNCQEGSKSEERGAWDAETLDLFSTWSPPASPNRRAVSRTSVRPGPKPGTCGDFLPDQPRCPAPFTLRLDLSVSASGSGRALRWRKPRHPRSRARTGLLRGSVSASEPARVLQQPRRLAPVRPPGALDRVSRTAGADPRPTSRRLMKAPLVDEDRDKEAQTRNNCQGA